MKFNEIDFHEDIFEGLRAMNFEEMTPVQAETIPPIMAKRDLIGCAQTGTGKTAAYVLPLLDRLVREGNPDNVVKSLIVVPTRELAQQIDIQFQGFAYFLPVSTTVVYGGGDGIGWSQQKQGMVMGSDVVVATPGRLLAHLANSSGIDLSHVEYFVLDEADRMLDMGFYDDIMKIISYLPKQHRQTLMFSATLPAKIREMAKQILHDPAEVNIAISKPNEAIAQSAYVCYENQKMELVRELFGEPRGDKTIIFASSKLKVKDLAFALKRMKLNVAAMHSDLEQAKREEVMLDFKNGKIDLLVATDIVSRGIDIEDIGTVVNYDVPHDPEDYIHRIGRTARASAEGAAITFISEKEQGKFHRIEEFIGRDVPKSTLPERLGAGPVYDPASDRGSDFRGRGRGGRPSGGGHASGHSRSAGGRSSGGKRSGGNRPARETRPEGETRTTASGGGERSSAENREHRGGQRQGGRSGHSDGRDGKRPGNAPGGEARGTRPEGNAGQRQASPAPTPAPAARHEASVREHPAEAPTKKQGGWFSRFRKK